MKRFLFLVLGVFLVFTMTACGETSDQKSETESNDAEVVSVDSGEDKKSDEQSEGDESAEKDAKDNKTGKEDSFYADALKDELPVISEGQLELSQESYEFITSNSNLLPAKVDEDIQLAKEKSESIDLRALNKNAKPYYATITSFEGYVVQVFEEEYDNGETASLVNVGDEQGNNHWLVLYKSTGDIFEEDYVQFWGIPVGSFSYETLDGGYQNSQIFFGAHIEKK